MTSVWIDPQPMDNGLVAVDVNIDGAPGDLFGAAFHLVILGPDWELVSYHLGAVFDGSEPFLIVSEKSGSLVTGVSLRRAEPVTVHDGKLITFYVRPREEGKMSFEFDYPVLSTYNNGRRDVDDAQWLGAVLFEDIVTHEEVSEDLEVATTQVVQTDLLGAESAIDHSLSDMYLFFSISFLLFFLLMGAFSFYFWWTKN